MFQTPSQLVHERRLEQHKQRFDKHWMKKPEPSEPLTGFDMHEILGAGAFGQVVIKRNI